MSVDVIIRNLCFFADKLQNGIYGDRVSAIYAAIALLRAHSDNRPNEPLTLEELRKMGLLEWLWVEVVHPSQRQLFRNVTSAYYQIYTDYTDGEALCCGWPGIIHEFEYGDYGKTWLAYRNKPVEVAP